NLPPCVGREKEIGQVMHILGRSTRNNVVLTGESGVGRRTIAHGVVQRVAESMGPNFLENRVFAAIDLETVVAAAQQSARPKEFLRAAVAELIAWGEDTIFVFDELHSLLAGKPADGARETTLFLKSALVGGKIRCIAIATPEEHRAALRNAHWLERCFS